jgi:hypothetical protein
MKLLSRNLRGGDLLIYLGVVWKVVSKHILRQECVNWIKISYASSVVSSYERDKKTFAFRKRRKLS